MRILSLLPSSTEIVCALGLGKDLVGRSHECDYPPEVRQLPVCTEPKFNSDGTSRKIDRRVKAIIEEGLSVYRVDADRLAELKPDLILTQDHCEACAASVGDVKEAVRGKIGKGVEVLSVSPSDIHEVLDSIRLTGGAAGAEKEAEELTRTMKQQLKSCEEKTRNLQVPEVLCLEWLDPLMAAGNWMPELLQIAGGYSPASAAGEHSPLLGWSEIRSMDPKIIVIIPCGYSIGRTLGEISDLTSREGWDELRAVRNKQVFIADGQQYFNRPGPRLVDSTLILGEIVHPSLFRPTGNHHPGWISLYARQTANSGR